MSIALRFGDSGLCAVAENKIMSYYIMRQSHASSLFFELLLRHTGSWFATYNFLSEKIPKQETQLAELGRRAILGFCSSAVSDTCSNSIRVVKVYKQSHPEQLTYMQCVSRVIQESGVTGLMFRGLETKILANGLQGILFSILWKHFEEVLFPKPK